MAWTAENIEKVRNLAALGLSAAKIANEMGISRNSVVGVGHRKKFHFLGMNKKLGTTTPRPRPNRVAKAMMQCEATPSQPDPPARNVSFAELKDHMCKFPSGDPQHPSFSFCGKPKLEGIPYCRACAKICYEPGR